MSADDETQVFDAVTWLRNLKIDLKNNEVFEIERQV
jgi:hypothetical protein